MAERMSEARMAAIEQACEAFELDVREERPFGFFLSDPEEMLCDMQDLIAEVRRLRTHVVTRTVIRPIHPDDLTWL